MTDRFAAMQRSLERLGASVVPVRDTELEGRRRERIIGAVNQQAARVHERRRGRKTRLALLAAAAVIGMVLVVGVIARGWSMRGANLPTATYPTHQRTEIVAVEGAGCQVRSGDSERIAVVGSELREGEFLVTSDGASARLTIGGQVEARVSPDSELRFPAAKPASLGLELVRGGSEFSVKPLLAGHSFTVTTPNALVTVHGTRFVVQVEETEPEVVTSVKVSEGRVGVTSSGRTIFLTAGKSWSSRAGHESRPRDTEDSAGLVQPNVKRPSRPLAHSSDSRGPSVLESDSPSSTLSEETRVYMAAMAFKRQGEDARALVALEGFLRRFPASPLVENARVERLRILRDLGRHEAAADEARRYMAEYPDGFGRGEARELAAPASSSGPSRR